MELIGWKHLSGGYGNAGMRPAPGSTRQHAISQGLNDMVAVEAPRYTDRQALTRELIDHGEQPQAAPVVGACFDKVIAPHVIGPLRPQSDARSIVEPQAPSWL